MKLSVHLITWNGAKYIPYLFESLRKQTFRDWFLCFIDNGSADETVVAIKKELENFPVEYKIIENKENIGFAPGHNQAFRDTDSEYFLLLNQDMYLEPDCLEKMVEFLDEHADTAAVSPRLMKWNLTTVCHSRGGGNPVVGDVNDAVDSRLRGNDNCVVGLTNIVDALGLKVFRSRRVVERFTGQEWDSNVIASEAKQSHGRQNGGGIAASSASGRTPRNDTIEVFGVSGAFPMFRRSMVKEVVFDDCTFLDESYHSYKEDVDLAYRLASCGYKSYVILDTVAYHDRSGAGPKEMDNSAAMTNKKKQSEWVKYHSYKNHLMTLYKNEYWQNFILDLPWILWYETKKFAYFLIFDRKVLTGLREVWDDRRKLADKRKQVLSMRKANWKYLRKWWK